MSPPEPPDAPRLVDVVPADGHVTVVARGSLERTTAAELDDTLRELSSRYDGDQITLDLTAVDLIDLDAVDALVRAGYRTAGAGGRMTLVPPPTPRPVLDLDALAATFDVRA